MPPQAPLPVPPEDPQPVVRPVPPPPRRRLPERPGVGLTAALCVVGVAATALLVWAASGRSPVNQGARESAQIRSAVASVGELVKSLRVGGTVATLDYASIRAPRMRGPRDSGRADLTLAKLAEPGTVVPVGTVVAEFELRWLEDHIADRESVANAVRSNLRKREADILILKETERQGRVAAKAEYGKALLDVRTAEVRSEIEAEVLRNVSEEARATWQQLETEGQLMERVHAADLRAKELEVRKEELHTERHERDYERLRIKAPIGGMIVLETMFNRSGQFAQTKPGDQVYPGALIMRVVDVSRMVVDAAVNQVDAQAIRIGDRAVVELDAYPGVRFQGRVEAMGALASSGGEGRFSRGGGGKFIKHIQVRILIEEQDERILPDLSASVDVLASRPSRGVIVPREAVREEDGRGGAIVHVIEGESLRRRRVSVGDASNTHALVATGLRDGEEILLGTPPADMAIVG